MLKINISRQAGKFLSKVQPKHGRQIARKLLELQDNPTPNDSIQLKGSYSRYKRVDVGEYRVVYYIDKEVIYVSIVGKRNDGEVYKILNRSK